MAPLTADVASRHSLLPEPLACNTYVFNPVFSKRVFACPEAHRVCAGDTPMDLQASVEGGANAVGVATGAFLRADLEECGAGVQPCRGAEYC